MLNLMYYTSSMKQKLGIHSLLLSLFVFLYGHHQVRLRFDYFSWNTVYLQLL